MQDERGSKKKGRTGSSGYKGKPSFKSSDDKNPGGYKKTTKPKRYVKTEGSSGKDSEFKKPYKKTTGSKKFGTNFKKEGEKKREDRREKPTSSKGPYKKKYGSDRDSSSTSDRKPYGKKPFGNKDFSRDKPSFREKYRDKDSVDKPDFEKKYTRETNPAADYKKNDARKNFDARKKYKKKTGIKTYTDKSDPEKTYTKETEIIRRKDSSKEFKKVKVYNKPEKEDDELIRLNKFIANAGICSRREADTFIQTGVVSVNGVIITELGYKVKKDDRVLFHDRPIIGEKPVYILLNKPKDYITTSKDPQNRKTVLDLVGGVKERIFPIGRLDRNTTGVLLLTNDGVLADKLMHPRKGVIKIYHAELDKRFSAPDMDQLIKGIELEDGFFKPDVVDYVEGMDKHHVGMEIHSGANHIVRRLFESLQYKVIKLDRVVYAGLTKKGLTRGKWRFLTDSELHALKMM